MAWERGEQACRTYQALWLLCDAGQAMREPHLQHEGAGLEHGGRAVL